MQQTARALGGAIGSGLLLASGLAVQVAGPAVLVSYVIAAGIWVPDRRATLVAGGPWLIVVAIGYRLARRRAG